MALPGAVWTAGRTQILGLDISVASPGCSGAAKTVGGESPPGETDLVSRVQGRAGAVCALGK
jgi:Fe-S cluster assembly iron-binding protein IscA